MLSGYAGPDRLLPGNAHLRSGSAGRTELLPAYPDPLRRLVLLSGGVGVLRAPGWLEVLLCSRFGLQEDGRHHLYRRLLGPSSSKIGA